MFERHANLVNPQPQSWCSSPGHRYILFPNLVNPQLIVSPYHFIFGYILFPNLVNPQPMLMVGQILMRLYLISKSSQSTTDVLFLCRKP